MAKRGDNIHKRNDGRWEGRYKKGRKNDGKDVDVKKSEDPNGPVEPYNVIIHKADQTLSFVEEPYNNQGSAVAEEVLKGAVPYAKGYDFNAVNEAAELAGRKVTYKVECGTEGAEAVMDDNGKLTVNYPGTYTVTAMLEGDDNYNPCSIQYCLDVIGEVENQGDFIGFENAEQGYLLGTSDTIPVQEAARKDTNITGEITYSVQIPDDIGVEFDEENHRVLITDYQKTVDAIRSADGTLELTVTATKAATAYTEENKASVSKYGADSASYKIIMTTEAIPEVKYTLPEKSGDNGWYKTEVTVTPAEGYLIAQSASGTFEDTTIFSNQGTGERYVYLKNKETGAITDKIPVIDGNGDNLKIDTIKPDALQMFIDYEQPNLIERLGMLFGFYKEAVKVTFVVNDELGVEESGVKYIDWKCVKDEYAIATDLEGEEGRLEATLQSEGKYKDKYIAEYTFDGKQYRGNLAFSSTDTAGNTSDFVIDMGKDEKKKIVVLDTISPTIDAVHAPVEAGTLHVVDEKYYYGGDVRFTFTVKEANFFTDDITVKLSKDGAKPVNVTDVEWKLDESDSTKEIYKGTFVISGDGDYVVSMEYREPYSLPLVDTEQSETGLVTFGSKGIYVCIYRDNELVAMVDKRLKVVNYLDQYKCYLLYEDDYKAIIAYVIRYDSLKFGNMYERSVRSVQHHKLNTFQKEVLAKYDPKFIERVKAL